MLLLFFERHPILSWRNPDGSVTTRYYDDRVTWVVAALVVVWLAWFLIMRYRRARALRRTPRSRADSRLLQRVVRRKRELSDRYLLPGLSANIHAVGVGLLGADYCIQVFVGDPAQELWPGTTAASPPATYRGVPLRVFRMRPATFISGAEPYSGGIRDPQEVIVGGISGANTNLTGQSGTIGYFCTRRSRWPRRPEVLMLSNSHVFADLRKGKVDDGDLIVQPSPGERATGRPIGTLVNFAELKFGGDANHVDAAVAKLWGPQKHAPVIPLIGAVKGHVEKKDVRPGEPVRKFGRTTGYTEGCVFSVYLDIRVGYDRTGQSAFFRDQILVEPRLPDHTHFVRKGDSGSLLVDSGQHALGLVFAGMPETPEAQPPAPDPRVPAVENYGVANPIAEVLDRLNIELLI
ncbi:MAG TPA: hypothetical protein VGX48_15885 [Pyrinomonadaceae bacterium]|jgi:hypothetical protein|nr:hypothetical protein [Pyrinomonadaceae bacterium]